MNVPIHDTRASRFEIDQFAAQIELFAGQAPLKMHVPRPSQAPCLIPSEAPVAAPNPHLLAAMRLARRMRKLPDRSVEETRTGLAICHQLKAFLQDEPTQP